MELKEGNGRWSGQRKKKREREREKTVVLVDRIVVISNSGSDRSNGLNDKKNMVLQRKKHKKVYKGPDV